jgi:hypothetical protein
VQASIAIARTRTCATPRPCSAADLAEVIERASELIVREAEKQKFAACIATAIGRTRLPRRIRGRSLPR